MKTSFLKISSIFLLVFITSNSFQAQEIANKKVQAGIATNFGLNFVNMGTSRMDKNGPGTNFSIGMISHTSFRDSKNFGFSSGLEFDFSSLKFERSLDSEEIFYNYSDRDILVSSDTNGEIFSLKSRKHKTIKMSIPIALLFRTDMIGDFRYFTKFGLKNSFVISNKMDDEGTDKTTLTYVEKTNFGMISENELFFFQAALGLSLGAEWNFVGSTALIGEMSYHYGIIPLFLERKEEKRTLYYYDNNNIKPFSNKATQNQFNLKIAILF